MLAGRTFALALLVTAPLLGCGDEDKGAPQTDPQDAGGDAGALLDGALPDAADRSMAPLGSGEAGVELSKTVGQLSDLEVRKLCSWNNQLSGSLQPSARQQCLLLALAAASVAECQTQQAGCQLVPGGAPTHSDCSMVSASGLSTNCADIRVADYEACLLATASANQERFQQLTCDRVGQLPPPSERPAICQPLAQVCPDLAP